MWQISGASNIRIRVHLRQILNKYDAKINQMYIKILEYMLMCEEKILGSDFIQLVTVDCKPKVFQISRSLKTLLEPNQEKKKDPRIKAWKNHPLT